MPPARGQCAAGGAGPGSLMLSVFCSKVCRSRQLDPTKGDVAGLVCPTGPKGRAASTASVLAKAPSHLHRGGAGEWACGDRERHVAPGREQAAAAPYQLLAEEHAGLHGRKALYQSCCVGLK